MRIFMIEAYGGPHSTNGSIAHFAVTAASAEEALDLVKRSVTGSRYRHFDLVEERAGGASLQAGIIEEGEGAHGGSR